MTVRRSSFKREPLLDPPSKRFGIFSFPAETNESVEMMDSTVVECTVARSPSPQAEAEAAAAPSDGASVGCEGQQVTPTSSPNTNSPVMISVEVRRVQRRPHRPPLE